MSQHFLGYFAIMPANLLYFYAIQCIQCNSDALMQRKWNFATNFNTFFLALWTILYFSAIFYLFPWLRLKTRQYRIFGTFRFILGTEFYEPFVETRGFGNNWEDLLNLLELWVKFNTNEAFSRLFKIERLERYYVNRVRILFTLYNTRNRLSCFLYYYLYTKARKAIMFYNLKLVWF